MKQPKIITAYRYKLPKAPEQLTLTPAEPDGDQDRWRERECFYVSIRDRTANDGSQDRYAIALGPFRTHVEATDQVDLVRGMAEQVDDRAAFYAYGTCKMVNGSKCGILNERMNFNPEGEFNAQIPR